MRLTPAQIGVHLICGTQFPDELPRTLADRVKSGREWLVRLAGRDFGYDLAAWHAYLKESKDGGYTWQRNVVLPKVMKEALASEEWRRVVAELERDS